MSSEVTLSFFCLVRGPEKPNRWRALGYPESEPNFYSPHIATRLIADLRMRVLVNAGQTTGPLFPLAHVTKMWCGRFRTGLRKTEGIAYGSPRFILEIETPKNATCPDQPAHTSLWLSEELSTSYTPATDICSLRLSNLETQF